MRPKIRTWVLCGFTVILALLALVSVVALNRTEQIADLARNVNSRLVDKTRTAADIVSLVQEIRFVDAFLLKVNEAAQADLARHALDDHAASLDAKLRIYDHYVDSALERALLANLQKSASTYLRDQRVLLDDFVAGTQQNVAAAAARLDGAFDEVRRQAKGLSVAADSQARGVRAEATMMADDARTMVLAVAGAALLVAALVPALLLGAIFRPLARVTQALAALARGELDVALPRYKGSVEIDEIVRALDVFRQNAAALSTAHAETKAAHERADTLARHDALTGLPNRRVLSSAIDEAIGRSSRRGTHCAVLMLDLDRFKPVNDVYGHGAGDRVLCEVAKRLSATLRSSETVARLGGDEFAVVIEFAPGTDAPLRIARRIAASIAEPIAIDGRSVQVGTSIGIAVWSAGTVDAEALLHAADLAMFKAKRDERGSFRFYEPAMDFQVRERADLEYRLQQAIENGDIRPHYQPLVDLTTTAVTGFEVLARWYDKDRVRPPSEFITLAEEAGLIAPLTYAVLRQACRDSRAWPAHVTLAVNITPAQISERQLPAVLMQILKEEHFAPSRLELEITENALIGDVSIAKAVIEELRSLGMKVSLDDFGTGYSSLHHLRDLKFDKIKIDRSFIQTMLNNPESAKIVETVLGLSRNLGMLTVAEGIENEDHLRSLVSTGCHFGQGYHLGKPLSSTETARLFEASAKPAQMLDQAA